MKYCDLHCHSNFSDGTSTPEEVIQLACSAGLSAVALTDHNTMGGLERAAKAADGKIAFFGGCELSTEIDGQELHLLGLFADPRTADKVQDVLIEQIYRKKRGNQETVERLAAAGYPLTYAEFQEKYDRGNANRVHIARYLVDSGIVPTINDAFEQFLAPGLGFYEEVHKPNFYDMIPLINESGGVSVWAHPLYNVDRDTCEKILQKAKGLGLDGTEAYYCTYSEDDQRFMQAMCEKYQLIESGGSDYHGTNKPGLCVGTGYGSLQIPYTCYENLFQRSKSRNHEG